MSVDDDRLDTPLAHQQGTPSAGASSSRFDLPGYRLLERIGEGGMGTVFEAEQLEPVRRCVAIKVVKPGMDSRAVLARFDSERQARRP